LDFIGSEWTSLWLTLVSISVHELIQLRPPRQVNLPRVNIRRIDHYHILYHRLAGLYYLHLSHLTKSDGDG
jgi:hypothetical protein